MSRQGECPTHHIEGQLLSDTILDGIELDGENRKIEAGIINSTPDRHIEYRIGSEKFQTYATVMSTNGISVAKVCTMRNISKSLLLGVTLCLIRKRLKRKRNPHRPALARTPFWNPIDPLKSGLSMMGWTAPPIAAA